MHYTYIVRCADGTLYTGWTTDLSRRMAAHNAGEGAKYTRSRRPVTLIYHECFPSKEEALRRECAIKRLSRQEKLRLITEKDGAAPKAGPEQEETT
ncbi:MAG: GIY-YIG nuclease family protein [Oscillospiraceae bacterium]